MQRGFYFWFVTMSNWFVEASRESILSFDEVFAVASTLRNFTKPVFQDYTFQGRIVGAMLRLGRVITAIILYALVLIFWFSLYLLWVTAPITSITLVVIQLLK